MSLIQNLWNTTVRKDYPAKRREYIRSSEIGQSYVDRYMGMIGETPTNPFSERTLRIFDAGKVIEYIVMRALTMSGILNKNQGWLEIPATKDHLRVTGRLDATIGGITDWEVARTRALDNLAKFRIDLDDELLEGKAMTIIDGLKAAYPNGLPEEWLVEVKSINSTSFWNSKKNWDENGNFLGYKHNKLQLYSYLVASGLNKGILLYVSKDDFTLQEVTVMRNDPELEEALFTDLRTISYYFWRKEMPPLAPEIVYNERKGVFETNWNVGRSLYLTRLYGYSDQDGYERAWHQKLLDINRALRHMRAGKVKPEDLQVIVGYDLEKYVNQVEEMEDVAEDDE